MAEAYLLDNGNLLAPTLVEEGDVSGTAMTEYEPGHPYFRQWMEYYSSRGEQPPEMPTEISPDVEEDTRQAKSKSLSYGPMP